MRAKIHLEEKLDIKADSKANIVSTESSGILKVINPSENTTMWGIKLNSVQDNDVKTKIDETITHIEAGKEHAITYETRVKPKIEISEKIDTNFNGEEVNSLNKDLVYNVNQTIAFELKVVNNYEFELNNIKIEKHLPSDTKDARALDPYIGETNLLEDENILLWTVSNLKAGEDTSIIISCAMQPTNVQPYKTGKIVLKCETNNKLSSLKPTIDGDADNVDLRIKAEETTVPNQWNIEFGLRNASDFEIMLKSVNIEVNDIEKFSENLEIELESVLDEPIWKQNITVESDGYPEVTKNFDYLVLYEVTEHAIITYNKENDHLNVVKVSAIKNFEPSEVSTYAVQELIGEINVTNVGTATIGKIKIEDTIPPYIEISKVLAESAERSIVIDFLERPKKELEAVVEKEERERATFEKLEEGSIDEETEPEIEYEPEPEDITVERKYHYIIDDLHMESGQTIKIKTLGKANKPKFDGKQLATSKIKAFASNPTKAYPTEALMDNKEPYLIVEFKKRSYELTSIFKKVGENNYEIEIPVSNTGDVALDNILIIQPIFNAEYVSHTPPTVDVTVEGANVKCHINQIKPGETTNVIFQVKADGPLRQQQATIRIED